VHSNAPRTRPESSTECQRFRVQLRNLDFVNPTKITSMYKSLVDENELSEQLKNFSNLAKKARENYIVEVFYNKNTTYLSKPIPITKEEAIAQVSESKMTKQELIIKLESFLELMGENCRCKYRGFRSKNKSDLLIILQEVRCLFNEENEINDLVFVESSI
ncbi:7760_t:CDS:1, partial [Entrophospora sp. SA101]